RVGDVDESHLAVAVEDHASTERFDVWLDVVELQRCDLLRRGGGGDVDDAEERRVGDKGERAVGGRAADRAGQVSRLADQRGRRGLRQVNLAHRHAGAALVAERVEI